MNLKIQTTPLFTRNGTKEEITANPNIIAAAFRNDVLKDGNNSDVIELKNGNLVIPRIRACIVASYILPLKTASAQIQPMLENNW